jgi:hypothetical protein
MAATQESPEARIARLRAARKAATEAAWENSNARSRKIKIDEAIARRDPLIVPTNPYVIIGHETTGYYKWILMGSAMSLEKAGELVGEETARDEVKNPNPSMRTDIGIYGREDGQRLKPIERPSAK